MRSRSTFALCASGVGVAGAAGCVAYVALSKAPLRRWLAVGIPVGLFVVWWFTLATDDHGRNAHRTLVEHLSYLFDGVTYSFQLFASDFRWLGIPLGILFVAGIAWQLRGGIRAGRDGPRVDLCNLGVVGRPGLEHALASPAAPPRTPCAIAS